ncbi:angiopoietin-related protein 2-like [Drosophila sulfurigaster albostrigata]|uniref:angiopoietin-related protein 2-like n=1 Tax=Drosophila sulfurigaster albostrigata TaxID=89887 RepID=UPI002D21A988|nr:angiopoietin-related protein 2-like [Drosophila sulfurigaster albostrigata]
MFRCIIYISFLINILAILCNAQEFNETNEIPPITSEITDLNAEPNYDLCLRNYVRNCAEAGIYSKSSGIYEIHIPNYFQQPFKVACDLKTQEGGWTIILRRLDGSVGFYRNWDTYKKGFGDLDGEFFLGLEKIHALTTEFSQELLVILEDFRGTEVFEKYEKFAIADEDELYALTTLSTGSGTAGDSLIYNKFSNFSTYDRNNDAPNKNCAEERKGAWWYRSCTRAQFTGLYNGTDTQGIYWYDFRDKTSLKTTIMMIRPRKAS